MLNLLLQETFIEEISKYDSIHQYNIIRWIILDLIKTSTRYFSQKKSNKGSICNYMMFWRKVAKMTT